MLSVVPVLSETEAAGLRARLLDHAWIDGRATAGHQSGLVKRNLQLAETDTLAVAEGEALLHRLGTVAQFVSAALPKRIFPPVFSRYRAGDRFGTHVDNAIRYGARGMLRTDLSATLFLSPLDEYDGGALVIEDVFGPRTVRLRPGEMVLYPSSSLHHVTPVERGERVCAIIWVQSLVRDEGERRLLFELDGQIQALAARGPDDRQVTALTGIYHNLVRRWAEA